MCKKRCTTYVFETLRDLTLRRHQSKIHKMVWEKFEKIMMYRSMMSQVSRLIYSIAYTLMGQIIWQQSEEYVETGEPENNALAFKV